MAAVEIAVAETGKTRAADAIRANARRIEAETPACRGELYKTASGTPSFKATSGDEVFSLSGFKLIQKATNLQGKHSGSQGTSVASDGNRAAQTDSAERNRSVGLMRRKSG